MFSYIIEYEKKVNITVLLAEKESNIDLAVKHRLALIRTFVKEEREKERKDRRVIIALEHRKRPRSEIVFTRKD